MRYLLAIILFLAISCSAIAETQRVILVWTGTNCPPCKNLKQNILPQADVQQIVKQYNNLMILNDPVAKLRQEWGITAYPTIQIVDVKGNKPIKIVATKVGVGSKQEFVNLLNRHKP